MTKRTQQSILKLVADSERLLYAMTIRGHQETEMKLQDVIAQCYEGNHLKFSAALVNEVLNGSLDEKEPEEVFNFLSEWADDQLEAAHLAGRESEVFGSPVLHEADPEYGDCFDNPIDMFTAYQ